MGETRFLPLFYRFYEENTAILIKNKPHDKNIFAESSKVCKNLSSARSTSRFGAYLDSVAQKTNLLLKKTVFTQKTQIFKDFIK